MNISKIAAAAGTVAIAVSAGGVLNSSPVLFGTGLIVLVAALAAALVTAPDREARIALAVIPLPALTVFAFAGIASPGLPGWMTVLASVLIAACVVTATAQFILTSRLIKAMRGLRRCN